MLTHPGFDPVALALGPLQIHWYGLMYLFGFLLCSAAAKWRIQRLPHLSGWQPRDVDDIMFYLILGVIFGGRFGYMLFYQPAHLLADPLSLIRLWEGGMSFHGGVLGVLLGTWWFHRKTNKAFFKVSDLVCCYVPIGLFFGRIGNFINSELWGAPTTVPWGMVFPLVDNIPRHPSMLYEAILEGPVLLALLWYADRRKLPAGSIGALFFIGYGLFRIAIELLRVPDAHLGYLAFGWLTMGQLLTLPMVVAGSAVLWLVHRTERR